MNKKQIIQQAWKDFKTIRNKAMQLTFDGLRKELERKQYCVSPVFRNDYSENYYNANYFKVTVDGLHLDIVEDEDGYCNISQDIYLEVDEEIIFEGIGEKEFEELAE